MKAQHTYTYMDASGVTVTRYERGGHVYTRTDEDTLTDEDGQAYTWIDGYGWVKDD